MASIAYNFYDLVTDQMNILTDAMFVSVILRVIEHLAARHKTSHFNIYKFSLEEETHDKTLKKLGWNAWAIGYCFWSRILPWLSWPANSQASKEIAYILQKILCKDIIKVHMDDMIQAFSLSRMELLKNYLH